MKREALQDQIKRPAQVVRPLSVPAPFGGWNTRDPVSSMQETDAVLLKNAVAFPGKVSLRKGAANHTIGFPSDKHVETLMPYAKASLSGSKLFAATDAGIYDATSPGTVGAAEVGSLTNGRWQHTMFTNSAGQFLIAVNGVDQMQQYNGSAWTAVGLLGSVSTSTLVDVVAYQERLFFVQKDSMVVHYLGAGLITGTPITLQFGHLFNEGGFIMAIGTWTVDGGSGSDDCFFIISSEGEVVVYKGIDPSSPTTWQLQGVYFIGRPVGRRCWIKYGSDALIITDRGIFPLSKARQNATIEKAVAITDKIEPTFALQATSYFSTFGWQPVISTNDGLLVVNVPISGGARQYVMQLQTMGWSEFSAWDARCWAFFQGNLYFGTLEKTVKAYNGASDFGSNIDCDIVPAFNYWGDRGQQKHVKLVRPTFAADGPFAYGLAACTDFTITEPTGIIAPVASPTALWGVALWGVSVWGSGLATTRRWQTVFNRQHSAFSPFLRISSNSVQPSLISFDYAIEVGGVF